jgi:hypothetical protein
MGTIPVNQFVHLFHMGFCVVVVELVVVVVDELVVA